MTNRCWHEWVKYFSQRGFECEAPAWPLKDLSPIELRAKHPDCDGEGKIRLGDIISFYEKHVSPQGENTILIGHSMGGLLVQMLLSREIGSAGIAVDSAPPKGVLTTKLSFLKANWPVVNPVVHQGYASLVDKKPISICFCRPFER